MNYIQIKITAPYCPLLQTKATAYVAEDNIVEKTKKKL